MVLSSRNIDFLEVVLLSFQDIVLERKNKVPCYTHGDIAWGHWWLVMLILANDADFCTNRMGRRLSGKNSDFGFFIIFTFMFVYSW